MTRPAAVLLVCCAAGTAGAQTPAPGGADVAALQLEENAEKQLLAEATGHVEPMTAEEAARCVRQSFSPFSVAKRWEYYAQRDRRDAAGVDAGSGRR